MPIKWTPETDQILLLKILETCNVTANVKAISEAWPSDRERPTSRAISERLFKIRNSVKNSTGTASLTVSNGAKPSPSKSAVEANNKHATSKETSVKKPVVNGKRKRGAESIDHNAFDDSEPLVVKSEDSSDTETGDLKKAKRARSTNATAELRASKIAQAANNNKTLAAGIQLRRLDPKSEYEMEETGI